MLYCISSKLSNPVSASKFSCLITAWQLSFLIFPFQFFSLFFLLYNIVPLCSMTSFVSFSSLTLFSVSLNISLLALLMLAPCFHPYTFIHDVYSFCSYFLSLSCLVFPISNYCLSLSLQHSFFPFSLVPYFLPLLTNCSISLFSGFRLYFSQLSQKIVRNSWDLGIA